MLPTITIATFLMSLVAVFTFFRSAPAEARNQMLRQNTHGYIALALGVLFGLLAASSVVGLIPLVFGGVSYVGMIAVWASTMSGLFVTYGVFVARPDND